MGLREKKKAETRKRISDLASALFVERGYNEVTVAEIAAKAEVAVQTLFNYFPTKESIIFDIEDKIEADIVAAIRQRKKGQRVLAALHAYFLSGELINPPDKKMGAAFMKLVRSSPELTSYFRNLWRRYEGSLAKAIHEDAGVGKMEAECVAKLVLEGVNFACNSSAPKEALNMTFKFLKNGWDK